ncbi:MAG: hypothetical protein QOD02_1711, partial [Mycobacterium sp.]|nr:hypothetical protein [Mycobacterium sp.]
MVTGRTPHGGREDSTLDKQALRSLFDLTGRTAIVTGGTRGIGLAIAEGLAAAGANVVVASRKANACDLAAQQLKALGGKAVGVPTHLGDLAAIDELTTRTIGE